MSTILKALRRIEDEKRPTSDRPLRDEVTTAATPGEPLARPLRRGLWLGAFCAGTCFTRRLVCREISGSSP